MSRKRVGVVLALTVLVGGGLFSAWYFAWRPLVEVEEQGFGPPLACPDESYSNILPADYVGPQACGQCHEDNYRRWSKHPHRFMNQLPTKASIKGNFDNYVWTVRPGSTVTFSTEGDDYLVTVNRPAQPRTRYKVTRTVGSRFVQFYIGVQTEGAEPRDDRVYTTEHKLAFGYWLRLKRWLPVDYFDIGEDSGEDLQDGLPRVDAVDCKPPFMAYTDSCVHCHNTYPHALRIFRPKMSGFPAAVLQPDRKALSAALADTIEVAPTADEFAYLPFRLDPNKHLVTMGISCESCHLGGREHAKLEKEICFFPANPHVRVTSRSPDHLFTGNRKNPATSQGICAQCHRANAVATYPNDARVRNSAEAHDLLAGACTTKIRCVDCHEPHTRGVPSGGPTVPKHVEACLKCHNEYSTPEKAADHSRHPAKAGVNCLDCHMLRISQGVDEVSRTHRISQPVEKSMVSAGAPNGCNLCHLDKSPRWALDELKRGWGRDLQPHADTPAHFLDRPAGAVWLNSSKAITRLVAMDAYARSSIWKDNVPELLGALNNENPTNRAFALFAFERMLGRPLAVSEIDILGGPDQRRRQIDLLQAVVTKAGKGKFKVSPPR